MNPTKRSVWIIGLAILASLSLVACNGVPGDPGEGGDNPEETGLEGYPEDGPPPDFDSSAAAEAEDGADGKADATVGPLTRYWLASSTNAVCNDGTPSGYYFRVGAGAGVQRWVILLEGGGFCESVTECNKRATSLKSSSAWTATVSPGGILSNMTIYNPDFHNANHVYVKYCSSDLWSGDRAASSQTGNYHFRGSRIVRAVIEDLIANRGLRDGADTQVLFTGISAGGIGTFTNADWVASRLPLANQARRVRALNDAGWIVNLTTHTGRQMLDRLRDGYLLWNGQVDASCKAAYPGSEQRCYLGPYVYPQLSLPAFVESAQLDGIILGYLGVTWPYDANERRYIDCTYAPAVRASLEPVGAAFSATVIWHGMLTLPLFYTQKVDDSSLRDLAGNWFFDRSGPVKKIQAYTPATVCP